jgi:hypothetical protein
MSRTVSRSIISFAAGVGVGAVLAVYALQPAPAHAQTPSRAEEVRAPVPGIVQLRLYTIDKGKLDDFASAWRASVYTLRTKMGYRIPFAAKIPQTNQFVWLLTYDGPEPWEKKEAAYYASSERKAVSPDPAQWIARPEQMIVQPVVGFSSPGGR